jgi:starch phosphorylase
VSELHTGLMQQTVFGDLHRLHPGRIVNKTNGITFRRWLHQANPGLTRLLCEVCGPNVLDDPGGLAQLADVADDSTLQQRLVAVKQANKSALARFVRERFGLRLDTAAIFDVQIKRIHEYKRQLLNLVETIACYQAILAEPDRDWIPRVKIFAGKAAPSYAQAKLIIKLANEIGTVINRDPLVKDRLKLVFIPDYNVSLAETIIPAADLSEQISTAGMEASGTGNMKLALNGALTIGTLDGANIEIREHVGADNIFIFGLRAPEVARLGERGFDATAAVAASPRLAAAVASLADGAFSAGDRHLFDPLTWSLQYDDRYRVAADFDAYWEAQRQVEARWLSPDAWRRASIRNIAGMSWFSADRTIAEYARDIWGVPVSPSTAFL